VKPNRKIPPAAQPPAKVAPAPVVRHQPGNGASVPLSDPDRKKLDVMQSMAVRLLSAREVVQSKNAFIAKQQAAYGERSRQDALRIAQLTAEVSDLTQQLMQTLNNAEGADNARLSREFALPNGAVSYSQEPDGCYSYSTAPPAPASAPPAAPVQAPDANAARREALLAELANMDTDGPDVDASEVPAQAAKA